MMIVDLIDEVDFKERMLSIGAPIDMSDTLDEVASKLKGWFQQDPDQISLVKAACTDMEASGATILPDVNSLMERLQAL